MKFNFETSFIRSQSATWKVVSSAAVIFMATMTVGCAPGFGLDSSQIMPDDNTSESTPSDSNSNSNGASEVVVTPNPVVTDPNDQQSVLDQYGNLDPNHVVPTKLLKDAVLYFDANKANFPNKSVITIVDFTPHSSHRRMFVVDMMTGLVTSLYVAHGMGSDPNRTGYATKFSNTPNSEMSSLGFFRTAETYTGKHGLQMRIDGLSTTNSKVRDRAVVVHGADYVVDAAVQQGRSWGCFAVPMVNHTWLINTIKGGSMMYANLE